MSETTVDQAAPAPGPAAPAPSQQPRPKRRGRPFWRRFLSLWGGGHFVSLAILIALGVVQASELVPGTNFLDRTRNATLLPLRNAETDTELSHQSSARVREKEEASRRSIFRTV